MKELTIEQKAQRYDEAIEKAKDYHKQLLDEDNPEWASEIEKIFPELKESDDEKIRKEIEQLIQCMHDEDPRKGRWLTWLEKQGGHESADKVKPKFHEGDWVVFNNRHDSVYQVEKIENYEYVLRHFLGGSMPLSFSHENMIKAWTIQDAKDGDVLACNEEILLFKSYSVQGRISLYCWYNGQTNNFHDKEVDNVLVTTRNKICPATKEQRDTLMKAMADTGYIPLTLKRKILKKLKD